MKSPNKEKGMGVVFWTLMVGIGAAGYFIFRKLSELEKEIRRELKEGETEEETEGKESVSGLKKFPGSQPVENKPEIAESPPVPGEMDEKEDEGNDTSLQDVMIFEILEGVKERPGILQTEFYDLIPEENRRRLQDILLQMDREGLLRREREGRTYRLYTGRD